MQHAAYGTDGSTPCRSRLPTSTGVRLWELSVPKRLRYFMRRDGVVLNMVLRIFLRVIAQCLQAHSLVKAVFHLHAELGCRIAGLHDGAYGYTRTNPSGAV